MLKQWMRYSIVAILGMLIIVLILTLNIKFITYKAQMIKGEGIKNSAVITIESGGEIDGRK